MKNKSILSIIALMISAGACLGAWNPDLPADNSKLKYTPGYIRANWDAIEAGTDPALQITNDKIAVDAGIYDTKLNTISTAGKVNASALTSLSSTPSGAGALPLVNGGTGQTTRQASLDALLDTQTGQAGKSLITNGTNGSWGYPADLSIASQAQGDLLYYGTAWTRLAKDTSATRYLANTGTSNNPAWAQVNLANGVTGTLPIANGGTGTTSVTDIGLPTQTGNSGKFLTTNGSSASWGDVSTEPVYISTATILIAEANAERSQTTQTPIKVKEIVMKGSGSISITFSGRANPGGTAVFRVYKNGSAVGTQKSTGSTSYVDFSDTLTGLVNGDLIQLYIWNINGGNSTFVKDFKLYGGTMTINTD